MEEEEFVMRQKLEQHGGLSEIRKMIMKFSGYRTGEGGISQEISVEIWDLGHKAGERRYVVEAKSKDGKTATGNDAPDVETAIAIAHWQNFD